MEQVCIVRASAGSGKTHALAKQYVRLLINPPHPFREILAITFTNKAAGEMKERILEFLKRIALDDFSKGYEKEDILSPPAPEFSRKKALALMDILIRNYHFFQVRTIDSFIKSLLSGCTFKTDFSSSFRIEEDYSENLSYSLDRLIDKVDIDKKIFNAFARFLKQYLYIENRASWFLKKDILSLMEVMTYFGNIYGYRFRKSDIKSGSLIIKKRNALRLMKRLKDAAPQETNQSFFKSLSSFLDKNKDTFDIDSISNSFNRFEFPVNKGCLVPQKSKKLWEEIRERLKEICELESVSLFNPYIDIFDMMGDEFKTLQAKDNTLFLEELNRHAKTLFDTSSITMGELYYRIATRLRHYLIDEVQDTSRLQWRNLIIMIEEALSTGGSLFCVGDRKQAIYRFRGGDVSLLDYVEDRFKKFKVDKRTLNMNFRSQKEVVLFNNRIFSEENLRRFLNILSLKVAPSQADEIINAFQDSTQIYKETNPYGYVRIECVEAQDKEETEHLIKEKTTSLIEELSKRFSYEHMAVLARDNDDVELVTNWLLERGIPVESAKTLNIKEHPHIKELISFMKFLSSPIDNLAFASFILGEVFTQVSGLSRERIQDFIFEIRKEARVSYIYTEFRKRFSDAWERLIDTFFKGVGFVPLYEFTVSILARFNVIKRFPESQGFFMRFLELVKEQEEVNQSLSLFLDFFEKVEGDDLYVDIIDSQYVKVLTIHKSKGLEFPIVIIPFLGMDVRIGMGKNSGRSFVVEFCDDGISLRRLKKRYSSFSDSLNALYKEEYKKSFIDELNSIYVAFTRAQNELYLFIPGKDMDKNLVSLLISGQGNKMEFGTPVRNKLPRATTAPSLQTCNGANVVKIPISRYRDWMPHLMDEFIDVHKIKNRHNLLKGEVLHYILSFIGDLTSHDINNVIRYAMEKACLRFPFVDMRDFEPIIKKLLKDKKLKEFFFISDANIFQEKELVSKFGDTFRIDRLIVKEKTAWVIDYKSSRDEMETSIKQIERYIKILRDLYPGKDVNGYLIFLDDFSMEEV